MIRDSFCDITIQFESFFNLTVNPIAIESCNFYTDLFGHVFAYSSGALNNTLSCRGWSLRNTIGDLARVQGTYSEI